MSEHKSILVRRADVARAGGVRAAVEEALSLAALRMTPRAMTAYEAAGMASTEEDGAGFAVWVEVQNEAELREAVEAGAEAVRLVGVNEDEAARLKIVGKGLREDLSIEERTG